MEVKTGATFLHPSNDIEVILGQGTACKELLEYNDSIEHVLVPIGGGGLIAGSALAAKYFGKNCTVIGAEPFEVDDAYRSLKSGKIETNESANTIADGLKTQLGDKNFPIIKNEIKSIIRITEEEIIESMKIIWERLKIICEPSCSLPLAAVLKNKETFKNKKVGIIISGGNVDLNNLPFLNDKGQLFYPTYLNEIQPKEFLKAKKLARPITLSEFEIDPDEYRLHKATIWHVVASSETNVSA